jgi:hypothetical protein
MEVSTFIGSVSGVKGANLKALWKRNLKTRKGVQNVVTKITTAVIRTGVDYDNIKTVIEGRQDGTLPEQNAGLPWGEWVQFPYHIQHKGQDYLRMYPASGLDFTPKTTYFIDGNEARREDVETLCLASEFRINEESPTCFTIKADSLMFIG